jgi:hypothetical protein
MLKIRTEINEMETEKKYQRSMKQEIDPLIRYIRLINS